MWGTRGFVANKVAIRGRLRRNKTRAHKLRNDNLVYRLSLLQHAGFFGGAQSDQAIDGIGGPVR
jgi:hypothetical protein